MKRCLVLLVLLILPAAVDASEELPKGWDPRPSVTFGLATGSGDLRYHNPSTFPVTDFLTDLDSKRYFGQLEVPVRSRISFLASYTRIKGETETESSSRVTSSMGVAEFSIKLYPF